MKRKNTLCMPFMNFEILETLETVILKSIQFYAESDHRNVSHPEQICKYL